MPLAIIGILLLMSIVDGRILIRDHSPKQWMVYLSLTGVCVSVLIVYSATFSKPNILAYLEAGLRPLSRWLAG